MTRDELNKQTDPHLKRETGEARVDGVTYRTVTLLNHRYRLNGILSVGGFGVIYTGEDTRLYNKKILVKANRYPRSLFKMPRNKAVVPEVEKCRFRLAFEKKMLLQAARRGISNTPVLLDEILDLGLDLYGPHQDRDGNLHHCTQAGEDGGELWTKEPFLVIGYVSGSPLQKVIPKNWFKNNILGNAKQVILQIGRILQRFHEEQDTDGVRIGFVYQDLKPDNIMFTDERNYVLIDFGGFAVRAGGKTLTRFAKTGTPGYQPPEFTDYNFPPEKIDARADVFSLGATVYHVLTASAPGADSKGNAVFDPQKLAALPAPWRGWIETAIAPRIEDRFLGMKEALKGVHGLPLGGGVTHES